MRRRRPAEKIERVRGDRDHGLGALASQCVRWVADHEDALTAADPEILSGLHDRAADNWRNLFAIADEAGGRWPKRARKTAIELTQSEDGTSVGVDLLGDIFEIFAATPQVDWMKSAELCQALVDTPDRPWSEIQRGGKALSTNGLARRLKPFGVRPEKRRQGETTPNGYHVASFAEAFDRYLAQPPHPHLEHWNK